MADEFKRLDRELVYKGSIVDFYKDTVKVPNGNVGFYQTSGSSCCGSGDGGRENPDGEAVQECP